MNTASNLLKNLIDPILVPLFLILLGVVSSFRNGTRRSTRLLLLSAFLSLYLPSIPFISNNICYLLEKNYIIDNNKKLDRLDIVVVLGGGIYQNKVSGIILPSNQTSTRLLAAVQSFRESGAGYMVLAGKGTGKLTEAEVMGLAAMRLGVPAEKIRMDTLSENTTEHARELNKLFHDKNIRIGLVTSAYHMKRSEKEFRKYFRNIIAMPSDYLYKPPGFSPDIIFPSIGNLYKSSIALQELVKIVWYDIKG